MEQDVGERFHYRGGRAFEQVRDACVNAAVLHADEAVGVGEAAELYIDDRDGRARLELVKNAPVEFLRSFEKEGTLRTRDERTLHGILHLP